MIQKSYPFDLNPSKVQNGNNFLLILIMCAGLGSFALVFILTYKEISIVELSFAVVFFLFYIYIIYRNYISFAKNPLQRISVSKDTFTLVYEKHQKVFHFSKFQAFRKKIPIIGGPVLEFSDGESFFIPNEILGSEKLMQELENSHPHLLGNKEFQNSKSARNSWDRAVLALENNVNAITIKSILYLSIWGIACGLVYSLCLDLWVYQDIKIAINTAVYAFAYLLITYSALLLCETSSLLLVHFMGPKMLIFSGRSNLYLGIVIPFILGPLLGYRIYLSPRITTYSTISAQELPPPSDYSKAIADSLNEDFNKVMSEEYSKLSILDSIRINKAKSAIVRLEIETTSKGKVIGRAIKNSSNLDLLDKIALKVVYVGRQLHQPPETLVVNGQIKFNWDFILGDPPSSGSDKKGE